MAAELAVGVDLGATKIASALVARGGEVVAARQTATVVTEGAAAVCDRIAGEVRELITTAGERGLAGVGIGSPGLVDSSAGVVRFAVNLRWTDVALGAEVSKRLGGIAVVVENDANANALGEGVFGAAAGARDYVLLTVGSGLGSGCVSGGRIVTGAHWMACDLGHYSVDPDGGLLCGCGRHGCAETVASGAGLVEVARRLTAAAGMAFPVGMTAEGVVAWAREGNVLGRAAVSRMARVIGEIGAVAAAVVDPEVIVLGGGLGTAVADLVLEPAAREMYRRLPASFEGKVAWRKARLASSAMGGAALVFARG